MPPHTVEARSAAVALGFSCSSVERQDSCHSTWQRSPHTRRRIYLVSRQNCYPSTEQLVEGGRIIAQAFAAFAEGHSEGAHIRFPVVPPKPRECMCHGVIGQVAAIDHGCQVGRPRGVVVVEERDGDGRQLSRGGEVERVRRAPREYSAVRPRRTCIRRTCSRPPTFRIVCNQRLESFCRGFGCGGW